MNPGGEPERDDTGLPPVDIEIPDDARELDRDVQAYHRELRAERRRMRRSHLHGSLARDGVVLPVLACCLILALIAGTLLTIFTATSDQYLGRVPGNGASPGGPRTGSSAVSSSAASKPAISSPAASKPGASAPASGGPSSATAPGSRTRAASSGASSGASASALAPRPVVVPTGRPLPAGTLTLTANQNPVPLHGLSESVLVLVPPGCRCGAAVRWLAVIGSSRDVPTYLVGTPQTIGEVQQLHSRLRASLRTAVAVVLDKRSVLASYYPVRGLTAVLVAAHIDLGQSAAYAQNLSAKDDPAPLVQVLSS